MRQSRQNGYGNDRRGHQRIGLGKSQRPEELAFGRLQSKDREKTDDSGHCRRQHRAAHFRGRPRYHLAPVFRRIGAFQMTDNIFHDHNSHIDHGADGDRNPGEGDDIGIDPEIFHGDEGHQHRQRKQSRDQQRPADVQHQQDHHDDGDQDFADQGFIERVEGFIDQAGAVIERHDHHLADRAVGQGFTGETGTNLGDFLFDVQDCLQRVFSVAGDHHPAHRFCTGLIQSAAAQRRAAGNVREVFDVNRHVLVNLHHRIFQVGELFDKPNPADDVLHLIDLDGAGADIEVGHPHRLEDLVEGDTVDPHRIGIDIDLVFLHKPAHRGHFADPFGGHQGIAHIPVLDAAQFLQIPAASRPPLGILPFQGIPEHLPQGGGVRPEPRLHPFRKRCTGKAVELFGNPGAAPVKVDLFFKNDVDAGETEHGETTHGFYAGNTQQCGGQGVGHLIFDILRGVSRPGGKDDLLIFSQIRDRIHRHRIAGQCAQIPGKRRHQDSPGNQHQGQ